MADKITQSKDLEINFGFIDEDTRKLKVPNALDPSNYTTSTFTELEAAMYVTIGETRYPLIVGDRTGAEFTGILTADVVTSQKVDFDLIN